MKEAPWKRLGLLALVALALSALLASMAGWQSASFTMGDGSTEVRISRRALIPGGSDFQRKLYIRARDGRELSLRLPDQSLPLGVTRVYLRTLEAGHLIEFRFAMGSVFVSLPGLETLQPAPGSLDESPLYLGRFEERPDSLLYLDPYSYEEEGPLAPVLL